MNTNHIGSGEQVRTNTNENSEIINQSPVSNNVVSNSSTQDNSCTRKRKLHQNGEIRIRNCSADNMHRPLQGETVSISKFIFLPIMSSYFVYFWSNRRHSLSKTQFLSILTLVNAS